MYDDYFVVIKIFDFDFDFDGPNVGPMILAIRVHL